MLELGKPVWLWNRLLVISAEDIGLADPTMVGYVRERYDTFENLRKQKNVKRAM
jgi:replication-associated recombination protein RarA